MLLFLLILGSFFVAEEPHFVAEELFFVAEEPHFVAEETYLVAEGEITYTDTGTNISKITGQFALKKSTNRTRVTLVTRQKTTTDATDTN